MDYRKPKTSLNNIFIMLAILVFVLILMFLFSKQKLRFPTISSKLDEFKGDSAVINGTYYNRPFLFSISAPDSNWKFVYDSNIDSTFYVNSSPGSRKAIVTMNRLAKDDTIAVTTVELIQLSAQISPEKLAALNLAQIKNDYKENDEEVSVVADATAAGSGTLFGAFHVVELPQKTKHQYPVWVTMFVVRSELAYKILSRTKRNKYELLRSDLENILKSFRFL